MLLKPSLFLKENMELKEYNPLIMRAILKTVFSSKMVSRKFKKTTLIIQIHIHNLQALKDILAKEHVVFSCTKITRSYLVDKKQANSCFLYSLEIFNANDTLNLKKIIKILESVFGGLIGVFNNKNYYWFDTIQKNIFINKFPSFKQLTNLKFHYTNSYIDHITLY